MRYARVVLLVVLPLFLVGTALIPAWTTPNTLHQSHAATGATITYTVERQLLAFPGLCTTVRWETSGIEAVHFNDVGRVGMDSERVCPLSPAALALHVELTNGDELTLTQPLFFVLYGPLSWLAALAVACAGAVWVLARSRTAALVTAGGLLLGALLLAWALRGNAHAAWFPALVLLALGVALSLAVARPGLQAAERMRVFGLGVLALLPLMTGYTVLYGLYISDVDRLARLATEGCLVVVGLALVLLVWVWRIPPARLRRRFNNALMAAFGIALALLLLEGGLRLVTVPPADDEDGIMRIGMALANNGLTMRPNTSWRQEYPSNPDDYLRGDGYMTYETNNAGFRDGPFTTERTPGVKRVALMGDSFALGAGVHAPDVAANVIERTLREVHDCPTEVYNFAIGGQDVLGYRNQLQTIVLDYQPDVVLLWYFLNDIGESQGEFLEDVAATEGPYFPVARTWSRLVAAAAGWLQSYTEAELGVQSFRETYNDPDDWDLVDEQLASIAEAMQDYDAPYGLFVHPILFRLDEGDYPYASIHDQLIATGERYGYFTADLYEPLAGYSYTELWAHPIDSHPNHIAHRLTGEYAAAQLAPVLGCGT